MKNIISLILFSSISVSIFAGCFPGMIQDKVAIKKALSDLISNQDSLTDKGAQHFSTLPLEFCSRSEDGQSHIVSARIQRSATVKGDIVKRLWTYKMISNSTCTDYEIEKIVVRFGGLLPSGCIE